MVFVCVTVITTLLTVEDEEMNRISSDSIPGFNPGFNYKFHRSSAVSPINRGEIKFEKYGLTFYKLSPSHLPLMLSIYTDPYANAMVAPVTHPTKQDIKRKLDGFIAQESTSGLSCYAVFCNKEEKYIGIAGVTHMDPEKTSVEVNYALRKQFRGQNLGKTLCQACCEFACENGFQEIYGETLSYNRESQYILITNGFIPNGIVKLNPNTNMKDTHLTVFVKQLKDEKDTPCPPKKSGLKPTDLHPDARDLKDLLIDDYKIYIKRKKKRKKKQKKKQNYLESPEMLYQLKTFLQLREKKNRPFNQKNRPFNQKEDEDRPKIPQAEAERRIKDWLENRHTASNQRSTGNARA